MGTPVVQGDGRVGAVAGGLGAPAAADHPAEIDVEAVVLWAAAIDAADHEIGVVAGDDVLGNGGGAAPEEGARAGDWRGRSPRAAPGSGPAPPPAPRWPRFARPASALVRSRARARRSGRCNHP